MTDKQVARRVYASIVIQALRDFRNEPAMREEIEGFFKSDWGKFVLGTLGLKYQLIQDKCQIAETNRRHRTFRRQYEMGLNDKEIAEVLGWSIKEVKEHRREYMLGEGRR